MRSSPYREVSAAQSKNEIVNLAVVVFWRAAVGAAIRKLQTEYRLEFPLVRNLGQGLWEIRIIGQSGKIRVFYCFLKGQLVVLLHGKTSPSQVQRMFFDDAAKCSIESLMKFALATGSELPEILGKQAA